MNRQLNLQEKLGSYVNHKYKPTNKMENTMPVGAGNDLRKNQRFSLMPDLQNRGQFFMSNKL